MIVILLALFSLSPNKSERFILPIFPLIAVLVSRTVFHLVKFRRPAIVILTLFCCFQYFAISYGSSSLAFSGARLRPAQRDYSPTC